MRLTLILLIGSFMQVSASGFAQSITLKEKNSSLESVLLKISQQSNYDFLYNSAMLKNAKPVNMEVDKSSLEEALALCFLSQPFTYSLTNNTVIVKKRTAESVVQEKEINGTVHNEAGEPVPGVSVRLKGSTVATMTGVTGHFTLTVPSGNSVLVLSFLGYSTQEIAVGSQRQLRITLLEQAETMDDVVVTALGIKRNKRELGYAVSELSNDEITGFGEPNAISAMAGKVAGVNISSTTAGPTGSSRVVIRGIRELQGSNQPLYVIDGIPAVNGNIGSADQWGGFDLEWQTLIRMT